MLLLFVALFTQDAAKFSPTSAEETLRFLVKLHEPVRNAGTNESAVRLAREKFAKAVAAYAGKEIKWKVDVNAISERAQKVFFKPVTLDDASITVDAIRITKQNEKVVAKLQGGNTILLTAKVHQIKASVNTKKPLFHVELKDVSVSIPKS